MKLQLPGVVIAGLYKDSLVLAEDTVPGKNQSVQQVTEKNIKEPVAVLPTVKKWFLGDNEKKILILLKDVSAVHINDEWLGTLSKLLSACRLNLGDVAIVNHLQHSLSFDELKEQLQPRTIFMFDVSMQDIQLPFSIPHYQVQKYGDCTFMTAPASTLSGDNAEATKTEKRKLWEKLKVIFNM